MKVAATIREVLALARRDLGETAFHHLAGIAAVAVIALDAAALVVLAR